MPATRERATPPKRRSTYSGVVVRPRRKYRGAHAHPSSSRKYAASHSYRATAKPALAAVPAWGVGGRWGGGVGEAKEVGSGRRRWPARQCRARQCQRLHSSLACPTKCSVPMLLANRLTATIHQGASRPARKKAEVRSDWFVVADMAPAAPATRAAPRRLAHHATQITADSTMARTATSKDLEEWTRAGLVGRSRPFGPQNATPLAHSPPGGASPCTGMAAWHESAGSDSPESLRRIHRYSSPNIHGFSMSPRGAPTLPWHRAGRGLGFTSREAGPRRRRSQG